MALQQPFTKPETVYANAYHRIVRIYIDLDARMIEVVVSVWATAADRQADNPPLATRRWTLTRNADLQAFSQSASNVLATAYNWLRNLVEYQGALDV